MQSLMAHFKNVFDYLFNAEWNPEYANAAHIKISPSTDARYPDEIRIAAIDSDGEIHSLCAYNADIALEPMSVKYEPTEEENTMKIQDHILYQNEDIILIYFLTTHFDSKMIDEALDQYFDSLDAEVALSDSYRVNNRLYLFYSIL